MTGNRVWNLVKIIFLESGITVNKHCLDELIDVRDETDDRLLGISIFEKIKTEPDVNNRKRSLMDDKLQLKTVTNPSVSAKFQKDILDEINWIKQNIHNQIPAPDDCSMWEYTCAVVIITLRRDKWYENKEKTMKRTPYLNLLYQLFYLQQWYRLWYRAGSIFVTDEDSVPILGQCIDFTDNGFPVLQDEDKLAPIKQWGPEKIYRAFNTLMRARLILEQGKPVNLYKPSRISVFMSYCHGLRDRLCMICTMGADGLPEQISKYHKEWFKTVSKNGIWLNSASVQNEYINGSADYAAIGKQIRQFQDSEYKERLKKIQLEENSILLNNTTKQTVKNEDRWKELEGGKEDKLKRLRIDLFQLETKLQLLQEGEGDIEEEDLKEVAVTERAINSIKKQLEKESRLYLLFQEKEKEEIDKQASEFITNLNHHGSDKGPNDTVYVSHPRSSYLEQVGVLASHVYFWLFPSSDLDDTWNNHDPFHATLKDLIRSDICFSFQLMDEQKLLNYIHKEIISHDIIFPEREAFRIQSSPDAIFTALDVCSNQRDDYVNFTEDELKREVQMHTQLPNFPVELPILLSKPPYDKKSWNIICHWWLIQHSPGVVVDRCYFLWDLEEEFSSLNRCDIPYPVMCRVGYDWIVLKGGKYTEVNVLGMLVLNGYWCGVELLDALTCWIILTSEHWKTKDRLEGDVHNLEYTKMSDLFTAAVKTGVDPYGALPPIEEEEEENEVSN